MRKIPEWGTELILKPRLDALAEVFASEDAAESESRMFRLQLLHAYLAAVNPNGPIAGDPRKALLQVAEAISLHRDLPALFRDLAQRLPAVAPFDFIGLVLHDLRVC